MSEHSSPAAPIALGEAALGQLMPLYLTLNAQGRILSVGPTLAKLLSTPVIGRDLQQVFLLRHARSDSSCEDLLREHGLHLTLRAPPRTRFKGVAVPMGGEGGNVLLNLSFGYGIRDAVREHGLSATDFAGTDLAIELLFLHEAKSVVMGELTRMADRLLVARSRAEAQALTDPLTGLGNRRAMEATFERYLQIGESFALIHADLDFFKQVNDLHGHAAGDHVLVAIAERLCRSVRGGDLVARIGGDEFVLLLPGVQEALTLERVGATIYETLQAPISFEGKTCPIGLSMGAVIVPPGGVTTVQALLQQADRALYVSKGRGKGRMTLWTDEDGPRELILGPPRSGPPPTRSEASPTGASSPIRAEGNPPEVKVALSASASAPGRA